MDRIERLFQIAAQEQAPVVDLGSRVLWSIQLKKQTRPVLKLTPFSIVAGLSGVAASIILFLAVNAWMTLNDPVIQMFQPMQVASLW